MEAKLVTEITSGSDLFFCEPYSCKLLARACVERQARFSAGIDKTALVLCGGCELGKQVQQRSGVVIDPASLVRGRGRPPSPFNPQVRGAAARAKNAEVLPSAQAPTPQKPAKIARAPRARRAPSAPVPAADSDFSPTIVSQKPEPLPVPPAGETAEMRNFRESMAATQAQLTKSDKLGGGPPNWEAPAPDAPAQAPRDLFLELTPAELDRIAAAANMNGEPIHAWSKEALLGVAHIAIDNPSFRLTAAGREVAGPLIEEVPGPLTREKLERGFVLIMQLFSTRLTEEAYEEWEEFLERYGTEVMGLALAAFNRLEPRRVGLTYQKHKLGATQQRIVDVLSDGQRHTVTDISRELGQNYQNTRRMLPVLERRGLIRNEFDQLREATVWMRSGTGATGTTPPGCVVGVAEGEQACGNLADHRIRLGKDYLFACASCAQGYVDVGAFEEGEDAELIKL